MRRWIAVAALSLIAAVCVREGVHIDAGGAPSAEPPRASPASTAPAPVAPAQTASAPQFRGSVTRIDEATRRRMTGSSWRSGCPVPIEDLRLLRLDYWGFDARVHTGALVVHAGVASAMVDVFKALFDVRFPIRRMQLVDDFGADDDRSMAADNTSGFNCRAMTGNAASWSEHSYGRAMDVNPVENPYVSADGTVEPPAGSAYRDRSTRGPGMIERGDAVVRAFAAAGWSWGGDWTKVKDYQHFSATGG